MELERLCGPCGPDPSEASVSGAIALSQVLPDREGKRCMFCVKTASRTYEMSASDTRQRQEWTAGECSPPAGLGRLLSEKGVVTLSSGRPETDSSNS